jgi:hypothetical protein
MQSRLAIAILLLAAAAPAQQFSETLAFVNCRYLATDLPAAECSVVVQIGGAALPAKRADKFGRVAIGSVPPRSTILVAAWDVHGCVASGTFVARAASSSGGSTADAYTVYLANPTDTPKEVKCELPPDEKTQWQYFFVKAEQLPDNVGTALATVSFTDGVAGSARVSLTDELRSASVQEVGNVESIGLTSSLLNIGVTTKKTETGTIEARCGGATELANATSRPGMCGPVHLRLRLYRVTFSAYFRDCEVIRSNCKCYKWEEKWHKGADVTRDFVTGLVEDTSELRPCAAKTGRDAQLPPRKDDGK